MWGKLKGSSQAATGANAGSSDGPGGSGSSGGGGGGKPEAGLSVVTGASSPKKVSMSLPHGASAAAPTKRRSKSGVPGGGMTSASIRAHAKAKHNRGVAKTIAALIQAGANSKE